MRRHLANALDWTACLLVDLAEMIDPPAYGASVKDGDRLSCSPGREFTIHGERGEMRAWWP